MIETREKDRMQRKMSYYKKKQDRRLEYRKHPDYRSYVEDMKRYIVTTRFNNTTWRENEHYREINPQIGCIYGTPEQVCVSSPLGGTINKHFHQDSVLFVLEMNNETNKIMGIGMIKNMMYVKKHRIYSNDSYNRYAYLGKFRLDRSELNEDQEIIFQVLDQLCFYGMGHLKKMPGIKGFPVDKLFKLKKHKELDLVEYITDLFRKKIKETSDK